MTYVTVVRQAKHLRSDFGSTVDCSDYRSNAEIHTPEYAAMCELLRSARTDANMSQRDLAKRLGVHHSVIAKIETTERRVDPIEFCLFLNACGTCPTEVFARVAEAVRNARGRGGRR